MEFEGLGTIIGIIMLLFLIYYHSTSQFNFWKSRNIPGPKPIFFFGTSKDIFFRKIIMGHYIANLYKKYIREPMFGIFVRNEPVLVINDMNLIKTVLIKDFKSFMDRGGNNNDKVELLAVNLFRLEGKRWRPLRAKLTPAFSSGKLKEMCYILLECAEKFEKYLDKFDGKSVDINDISAKFTTDAIGACVFGVEACALDDDNSMFRKMGMRIFSPSWRNFIRFTLRDFMPSLYSLIGRWFADTVLEDFFINLVKDTIEYRTKNNIKRHDFVDSLAALRNGEKTIDDIELTDSVLAAQLFIFFVGGFETSSSTITNCLVELASNNEIQNKVREEIKEHLNKNNGKITYDMIHDMTYLDQVYKETLRKYPPAMFLVRKTTEPYTIPDFDVFLPTGTAVWIPVYGIHHDSKYYSKPEVFDPERFDEEETKKRPTMSYLPYGAGPRNCIAFRLGQLQTKIGLIKILQNYTVNVSEETDTKYKINQANILLAPQNGTKLLIKKR